MSANKILINIDDTDLRVAFLEDGKLVGLQIETYDEKTIVGNIYKGVVEGIVPSLKAVFVNIGLEKNAFLHFSDVRPEFKLPQHGPPTRRSAGESNGGGPSQALTIEPAQEPEKKRAKGADGAQLEVGDTLLVQAIKDEIGEKGARISTHIAQPGRFLVYLPYSDNDGGVSRRIEAVDERKRLRKILEEIQKSSRSRQKGAFIVRTAGLEQNEEHIRADVRRLRAQWAGIERKAARSNAPSLIHNDHDILFRLVRDHFPTEKFQVVIDDPSQAKTLERHIKQLIPEHAVEVAVHKEAGSLFEQHDVERQILKALKHKVWLKSGASIVIEETEGMTAIDVNTGKFVGRGDQEEAILKTNLEAAHEIINQLRVRDIGGIIVVDFIDMVTRKNQEKLLQELGALLKKDRAKSSFTGVSEFGLVQITRERVRQSLAKTILAPCPYCEGAGQILSKGHIWRKIKFDIIRDLEGKPKPEGLEITVHPEIRKYLEDELLDRIKRLANRYKITLKFVPDDKIHIQSYHVRRKEAPQEQSAKKRAKRGARSRKSTRKASPAPAPADAEKGA